MAARVFRCSLLARFKSILPPRVGPQSIITRSIYTQTSASFRHRSRILQPAQFTTPQRMALSIFKSPTEYDRAWWREVIIYQIYVHSFKDSNGDGIGDLKGAIEKVPYLKSLGIDVVWLTPVYESPLKDMGYDISDYERINPLYGTLDDWQTLLEELHKRDMRLIMDLVVNHTSDQVCDARHTAWTLLTSRLSTLGSKSPAQAGITRNTIGIIGWTPSTMIRVTANRQTIGEVCLEVSPWSVSMALRRLTVLVGPAWTWDEGRQQYCKEFGRTLFSSHSDHGTRSSPLCC